VLPAAGSGEKAGTTTNLEGRISRLGRKVTAPGTSRPDWMIAVELADRLGADLGFSSLGDIWAEIEKLAAPHRGLTLHLLAESAHRSGIVIPVTEPGLARPERYPQETGAVGGGSNVIGNPPSITEKWDEVPRGGLPHADEPKAATLDRGVRAPATQGTDASPTPGRVVPPRSVPTQPSNSAHANAGACLMLIASRKLYDDGVSVQHSPALAGLSLAPWIGVHPADLDRLGLHDGEPVTVASGRGSLDTVIRADPDLVAGAAWMPFGQPGGGVADSSRSTARSPQ
jgi:NADH-quinone oxidoreductase subunit G